MRWSIQSGMVLLACTQQQTALTAEQWTTAKLTFFESVAISLSAWKCAHSPGRSPSGSSSCLVDPEPPRPLEAALLPPPLLLAASLLAPAWLLLLLPPGCPGGCCCCCCSSISPMRSCTLLLSTNSLLLSGALYSRVYLLPPRKHLRVKHMS